MVLVEDVVVNDWLLVGRAIWSREYPALMEDYQECSKQMVDKDSKPLRRN